MARHLLTDRTLRGLKPKAKPYREPDGDNLYAFVGTSGVISWQLRYKLNGVPQTATLGKWPAVGLAEARERADAARKLVEDGKHVTTVKRVTKLQKAAAVANRFDAVSSDWVKREARRKRWTPAYRVEVEASLRNHLSKLNRLPLSEIAAPIVAPVLRAIESTSPHMLGKVKPRLHAIMDYGVEMGIIPGNPLPAAMMRGGAIERRHFPAITDLPGIGAVLREARAADVSRGVQRAHVLLVFTAQRVSEVTGATWDEFDLQAGNWTIPRARMKQHKNTERGPHVVPLPAGLLAALREWRAIDGDGATFVCPAPRDSSTPITPEAVEKFYRRALELAGRHSPHSWRSAFKTIASDAGKDTDSVEAQMDHVIGNKVASAYDRAQRLERRRDLMQWYEATLIAARDGADVVPLRKGGQS